MQVLEPAPVGVAGHSEDVLVQRAKTGDADAFADLYERLCTRVFRYFFYRVGHREEAEDLTEQVFLKAWQAMPGYDWRGVPFSAWIFRLAHNLLIDHKRSSRDRGDLDEALEIEDESEGPEEMTLRRVEAHALATAIGQLSAIEQTVVILRFVERIDHRSVASIIDKTEVATRSIQSRALARLARLLEGAGREQE